MIYKYFLAETPDDSKGKFRTISDDLYDSEDSDVEEETLDRIAVFEFLQRVSMHDLLKLRGVSERKAKIIIESRPFTSWKHMVRFLPTYYKTLKCFLLLW